MKVVALKDVCRITNGGTPKSGIDRFWHGEVAWLTPAEMGKRLTPYITQTARTISQDGLSNSSAKLIPKHSVILSTRAPIGHLAINEVPMAFNQGCRGLTPNDCLDTKYLYYFLLFNREALDVLGTGTTFKELSSSNLASFRIPLPPLDEQRRIVAVLDKAFAGIATATANAQKNLANARAHFESYLHSIFHTSGKGWPVERLANVSTKITDGTHNSPKYAQRGIPMLDSKHIGESFQIEDSEATKFISPETDLELSRRCKPLPRDILISSRGSIGKIAIVALGQDFNIMGNMILVRMPKSILPEYGAFFFKSEVSEMEAIAKGVAQKGLYLNQIRDYKMPIPPMNVQADIVSKLDALMDFRSAMLNVYESKLAALAELKQSLLQRAFAGELT